jgi:predicted metal-dependent hydrolase
VFVRHPRARRYILRLEDDGAVRVTIPRWGSKKEARAFAIRERAWIEKQRRNWREAVRGREGLDGRGGQDARAASERRVGEAPRRCVERARRELPRRLFELAAQHGLAVKKVSIRNQKWRWGSCSPDGHICLNWRLVLLPDAVRDYVLIHELMHLRRMDHSPRFWKLVEQACPDYRELRRALRAAPPLAPAYTGSTSDVWERKG